MTSEGAVRLRRGGPGWPFAGRAVERELVTAALRPATGCGVVLAGAPGVGRTRLAREVARTQRDAGARVRWVAGTESARHIPLGAFFEPSVESGTDLLRQARSVVDAVAAGAERRRVVVVVDDAHLLDELSAFVVHRLVAGGRIGVVVTVGRGTTTPGAITALWKDQVLPRIDLQPLSLPDTGTLLEAALDGPVDPLSARRLWALAGGNVHYLRYLVEAELADGRLAAHRGVWLWRGTPRSSDPLIDLISVQLDRVGAEVIGVLDLLTVADTLPAAAVAALAGADALAEAERCGLVAVSGGPTPSVRLAYPVMGEARRARASRLHLRRIRGLVAEELAAGAEADHRRIVRRATLLRDSDLPQDRELLVSAARSALVLADPVTAESLATVAVAHGGGSAAELVRASALMAQERGDEAEVVLAGLTEGTAGMIGRQVAVLRAMNLMIGLGRPHDAANAIAPVAGGTRAAVLAWVAMVRGDPAAAAEQARTALASADLCETGGMLARSAAVGSAADLGRPGSIAADHADDQPPGPAEATALRFAGWLTELHAYRLAGRPERSAALLDRIGEVAPDIEHPHSWHLLLSAMHAMDHGDFPVARRALGAAAAYAAAGVGGPLRRALGQAWQVSVDAVLGEPATDLGDLDGAWLDNPLTLPWRTEYDIATAWAHAARGAVTEAVTGLHAAAAREAVLGRPGREVVILQLATRFGDAGTHVRLRDLAGRAASPRAQAVCAHATALAVGDGVALTEVARRYAAFGDRASAADALAQASVAFRRRGRRGSELAAAAAARQLADACGGIRSPALRATDIPVQLTGRQSEIVGLAAVGLTNREIAERLVLSVRTVEGHMYRTAVALGVTSRREVIALAGGVGSPVRVGRCLTTSATEPRSTVGRSRSSARRRT